MICLECKGAGVIEACTWCGVRGHTWHPAQVQEARRLLCEAVDSFERAMSILVGSAEEYGGDFTLEQECGFDLDRFGEFMVDAENECDRAAAVLGLKWEDADETRNQNLEPTTARRSCHH